MKYIAALLILACVFGRPVESQADLVVTLGGVSGVSTNLDVTIEGSGTLSEDTWYNAIYDFIDSGPGGSPIADVNFFSGITHNTDNNIGDIVSSEFNNFHSHPLSSPITLSNHSNPGSVGVTHLYFDNDGVLLDPFDDFNMVFIAPDSFIESGDSWSISGYSSITLTKGDASDFFPGTYSYTDTAIGEVTLIIQEASALAIPEPSTALIFIIGGGLLMLFRKHRVA